MFTISKVSDALRIPTQTPTLSASQGIYKRACGGSKKHGRSVNRLDNLRSFFPPRIPARKVFCSGWSVKRMPMKTGDGDTSGIPSNVPAFLVKLWKLVEDPQYEEHISWNKVLRLCCFHFLGFQGHFTLVNHVDLPFVLKAGIILLFSVSSTALTTMIATFRFFFLYVEWNGILGSRSSYVCTRNPSQVFQTQQLCKLRSSAEYV